MKKRTVLAMLLVLVLMVQVLSGCGKAASDNSGMYDTQMNNAFAPTMMESESLSKTDGSTATVMPANQKLIRTVRISAETEDMDALLSQVEQRIAELGGYVENREVYYGNGRYNSSRNATLKIRIPAQQLDQFVNHVSEVSNIISANETTEDITLSYVENESRVKALETEETRLLELLAMAETMEDLLLIEDKLTDVRTQLEQVKSKLKVYDNLVSYGTISLSVAEVREYTPIEEPQGFLDRVSTGFKENIEDIAEDLQEFAIWVLVSSPQLLVAAAVIVLIVLLIKRKKKKKAAQQRMPQPPMQPPMQQPPQNPQ